MHLIDTNIISELTKGNNTNRGVIEFFYSVKANNEPCYLSVVTIGELHRGVGILRHRNDVKQADRFEEKFLAIETEYRDNILPIDQEVAAIWASLRVPYHENILDKFIAATALLHSLQVVTRNVKDFARTGVPLFNPFT